MEKQLLKNIILNTKSLIHSDDFLNRHRLCNGFTRQSKLSFTDIIYFILSRENKSISINFSNMRRAFPQLNLPSVSKQAISKARQKVSSDACKELCQLFTKIYYTEKKKRSLWHGYHIYAIDGSTIQIPLSKENVSFWGSNPNQSGIEEPLASASMLYDVMDGIIIDSMIGKYRLNEREYASKHIDFFINQNISGNHLFLFDRGYPSYELFETLISNNLFFVMRLSLSFKKLIDEQKEDTIISYRPKGRKRALSLRVISILLPDNSREYLVTNITSQKLQSNKNFVISQIKSTILNFMFKNERYVIKLINCIINEAILNRSEICPGRKYPRHKKYTRRKYFINNKPCI